MSFCVCKHIHRSPVPSNTWQKIGERKCSTGLKANWSHLDFGFNFVGGKKNISLIFASVLIALCAKNSKWWRLLNTLNQLFLPDSLTDFWCFVTLNEKQRETGIFWGCPADFFSEVPIRSAKKQQEAQHLWTRSLCPCCLLRGNFACHFFHFRQLCFSFFSLWRAECSQKVHFDRNFNNVVSKAFKMHQLSLLTMLNH